MASSAGDLGRSARAADRDPWRAGGVAVVAGVSFWLAGCGAGKVCDSGVDCDTAPVGTGGVSGGACDGREGNAAAEVLPVQTALLAADVHALGSPASEAGRRSDELERVVELTRDLQVGVVEVSQAQWAQVMEDAPSHQPDCPRCPVEAVSWHDAARFANRLSVLDGLPVCYTCTDDAPGAECSSLAVPAACDGWRMPTEAEWEAAARAGSASAWAGDDAPDPVAWTADNTGRVCPAGGREANAAALFDLSGNVWEWTNDGYGPLDALAPVDPSVSLGDLAVVRGGSWFNAPTEARVAARRALAPGEATPFVGLRLVRSADGGLVGR